MNKQKNIIFITIFIVLLIFGCLLLIFIKRNTSDIIPNDYIAKFYGGTGELIYETYIYKIDNGKTNMGFKYINVTKNTQSWGSSNWKYKINNKGEFDRTDGAFMVAKKHGAYSYVKVPNNDKIYTIEEFKNIFVMN